MLCGILDQILEWEKNNISRKTNEICMKSVVQLIGTVDFNTSDVYAKIQGKVVIYNNPLCI